MLLVERLQIPGLSAVSFALASGECVSVQGPSGAGKTLLLRAIADLDPCDGNVFLDGIERRGIPAPLWRRRVGYVPAEAGWWAECVGDHFEDWARVLPLVKRLGLPENAKEWPVARASTGERSRLALIRALTSEPRVLLLDEPTAALDISAVALVEALVAERVRAGLSLLWVTHNSEQASRVAKRGLIVEAGAVREVIAA